MGRSTSGLAVVFLVGMLSPACVAGSAPETAWTSCGWGGGGFFWSCVFDPRRSGVIYLGGDVAGAYKSEDYGATWRFINRGLSDYAVYALAISPSSPDTLLAGTTSGICKTTDGGRTWSSLESTGPRARGIVMDRERSIEPLAFDSSNADIMYAGGSSGTVFKSSDGGAHWAPIFRFGPGVVSAIAVAPSGKTLLAMHADSGLARSEDGGATWKKLDGPGGGCNAAFSPADPGIAYAAFGRNGVWKSEDGGRTWRPVAISPQPGLDVRQVVLHPTDPRILWCLGAKDWGGAVMRSDDGGLTWAVARSMRKSPANPTLPQEDGGPANECGMSALSHLAVSPSDPGKVFAAGNWRNAWSSDGGKTWEERVRGADITCVTDIQFSGTRTFVTAMDEGLLASSDRGQTWEQLSPLKWSPDLSGHQWRVRVLDPATGRKLISTVSLWEAGRPFPNRILVSDDGGKSFATSTKGLPQGSTALNTMWGRSYARALEADPNDPNTVYLGLDGDPDPGNNFPGGGLYRSRDGGRSWARLSNQPGSLRMFYALAVAPTTPCTIYWGACGDKGGLYRSTNEGKTWARVFDAEAWIFNAAVSPAGTVYAAGKNLWKSGDRGKTWRQLTSFDDDLVVVGLTLDPADERRIWISRVNWDSTAEGGVYRTNDGGGTWEEITGDLPCRKPLVLRYNPATRELWAGGPGLFRTAQ